jgi:hypothetical protein
MNITTSLIFIPKDAIYVKKSLSSDVLGTMTPQSPLLRNVNPKKKKEDRQPAREEQTTPRQEDRPKSAKKSGEKKYIINKTESPIHITLTERDNEGKSIQRLFVISKYIQRSKFSLDQLESPELISLYDGGFIFDGSDGDLPKGASADESGEILERKYKSRNADKRVHTYADQEGNEKSISITEDLRRGEKSVLVEDDDIPEPSVGISEMFNEAISAGDGSIDDLIPKSKSRPSGGGGSVRRRRE